MMSCRLFVVLGTALLGFVAFAHDLAASPEANRARKQSLASRPAAPRAALAEVAIPNTNNTCASAVTITTGTFVGTTTFATNEGEDACDGVNDVWFAFTPTRSTQYVISTEGSNFDTVIALYSSCPGTLGNLLDCADGVGTEELLYSLEAGVTYRIRISGYLGEQGAYVLTVDLSNGQISSEYVNIAIDSSGNFTIGVIGQTPGSSYDLLYGHPDPWSGGTTLRVDGIDYSNMDSDPLGTKLSGPLNLPDGSNRTVWQAAGIRFSQRLSITQGQSGNQDNVVMEYTAENIDTASHTVGIRIFLDTYLGSNDGVPFRVPGLGTILFERELWGADIPPYWTSFESLANPERQSQGSLITAGMRPPDRVIWGYWADMFDSKWNYSVDPNQSVTHDSAVGIYWYPVPLAPGQSLTIGNAYGKSAINTDATPPLTTALLALDHLENVENRYTPNPWALNLFIEHSVPTVLNPVNNVKAELILPPGLTAWQPTLVELGNLDPGASTEVQWLVEAAPQIPLERGARLVADDTMVEFDYSVKLYADGFPTKEMARTLRLPFLHTRAQSWSIYP